MDQTADNHIFKFLMNKLSKDSTDFETQLYLCNDGFKARSSYQEQQLHQKKLELENNEKFKSEEPSSTPSFLGEMSNRPDLCFHIGKIFRNHITNCNVFLQDNLFLLHFLLCQQ